jgi:hypothetical protein
MRGLLLDGLVFPQTQFRLAEADVCDGPHWHMRSNYVVSIGRLGGEDPGILRCHEAGEFVSRTDPDPGRCGFGKVSQVLVVIREVPKACYDLWLTVAPS